MSITSKKGIVGIVLAGGSGSRLAPMTSYISKQLIPVYDKPMIYGPISAMMMAGIKDIIIISTEQDLESYKNLLGTGDTLGCSFKYIVQEHPNGIAEAYMLPEVVQHIRYKRTLLILGDNFFYGTGFKTLLKTALKSSFTVSSIFAQDVKDPRRFGVIEHQNGKITQIEEKPEHPKSSLASVGLYAFPGDVTEKAKCLVKSTRGEYEITDLIQVYINEKRAYVTEFGRGFTWYDTGTIESLHECANFVKTTQERTGKLINNIHEIAYAEGFISKAQMLYNAELYKKTSMYENIKGIK